LHVKDLDVAQVLCLQYLEGGSEVIFAQTVPESAEERT